MRIAKVRPKGRLREIVVAELEDGTRAELSAEAAARHGWATGTEVTPAQWETALREDEPRRCRIAAWSLLNHRPRSAGELRAALVRKRYRPETADAVVADLRAKNHVEDAAYARLLVRERLRKGDGPRAIRDLLRRRGIAEELAAGTLESENPEGAWEDAARALLEKWNRRTKPDDPRKRRLAAAQHLLRKGYEADLAWRLVEEVVGRGEE